MSHLLVPERLLAESPGAGARSGKAAEMERNNAPVIVPVRRQAQRGQRAKALADWERQGGGGGGFALSLAAGGVCHIRACHD